MIYRYNTRGNRYRKTVGGDSTIYYYDSNTNRLTSESTGLGFWYNDSGDPKTITENGVTYNLEYDPFHNMKRFSTSGPMFDINYSYGYDSNGQRIYKDWNTDRIIYVNDKDGNVLLEVNGAGEAIASYIYLNGTLVAHVGVPSKKGILTPWLYLLLSDTSN